MDKKPEVGIVAPKQGKSDLYAGVTPENPMVFVAFRANEVDGLGRTQQSLKPKLSVEVPASRVCHDADRAGPDGKPVCDFRGWDLEDALTGAPPPNCPGNRYNGEDGTRIRCGRALKLVNGPIRTVHAKRYQFVAISPQIARFLASKFPRDSERADNYMRVTALEGITYPGKGRTWRDLLDNMLIPELELWNKGMPKVVNDGPEGMTEEMPREYRRPVQLG